jgi:hypothetical protein
MLGALAQKHAGEPARLACRQRLWHPGTATKSSSIQSTFQILHLANFEHCCKNDSI